MGNGIDRNSAADAGCGVVRSVRVECSGVIDLSSMVTIRARRSSPEMGCWRTAMVRGCCCHIRSGTSTEREEIRLRE